MIPLASPDRAFDEIDAAPEIGEPGTSGDGVDGGRDGCEGQRGVQADQYAMVGEDHRPERREILEAGSGEEAGRSRDGGGQPGADLPGLHPRPLELERRRVVLRRAAQGATIVARPEESEDPSPGRSVRVHPEPRGGLGPDRSGPVVPRRDLDVDTAAPPVGARISEESEVA